MPAVLIVGNFLSGSVGTRGVCEELAVRLEGAGWRVLTASSRPSRAARLGDMLATVWSRRHEYDVAQVDVYSGAAFFWAESVAFALRRAGKPYVLTLHGGALPAFARRWPGRVRRLLASAAAVTAPSAFLLDEMRPYRADARLIPNAVEIARYPFRLRRDVRPSLVWVRAFHQIYDPAMAVRALVILRERAPEATLDMVGPDKHDGSVERVRDAAATLGVAGAVRFHGRVPKTDVSAWINRGDIFLNTTTIDNAPVTIVEAMACGACIVSTDAGGVPRLVADGTEALLVRPGDAAAMAAAAVRLLDDTALAARLSRAARARAEAFDWAAVLPQWEALLDSLRRRTAAAPAGVAVPQP